MRFEYEISGDGRSRIEDVVHYLESLRPGTYEIEVTKIGPNRTRKQEKTHWRRCGLLVDGLNERMREVGKHAGYSKGAVHELIMHRAGFHDLLEINGEPDLIRWSSTMLTVEQYSTLFEHTDDVADFLGVNLSSLPKPF